MANEFGSADLCTGTPANLRPSTSSVGDRQAVPAVVFGSLQSDLTDGLPGDRFHWSEPGRAGARAGDWAEGFVNRSNIGISRKNGAF